MIASIFDMAETVAGSELVSQAPTIANNARFRRTRTQPYVKDRIKAYDERGGGMWRDISGRASANAYPRV
jgi:hypothetical protein